MHWGLAIVALAILGVAAVSRRLSGTPVTPAMVFVAIGVLAGPLVLGEVDLSARSTSVQLLAEATLALVLFSDASRIRLRALRSEFAVPARLLGIGLPLTIAAGMVAALALFPAFSVSEALVLAVILAPTDAALGQAVVTEPRLPSRIRQGLNVESGLNDGICVPLLLIVLAGADVQENVESGHHALTVVAEELGYGFLGGALAGIVAAAIVAIAGQRGLISRAWSPIVPVGAVALAYGTAIGLGGSGFIAAFVAGLFFAALLRRDPGPIGSFNDELGELLNGVTFLAFGAILLGPALEHIDWRLVVYAALSLTVVRMLPVAIAMLGSQARPVTVAFMGWFGPRGLASIVFAVLVLDSATLPGTPTILLCAYLTVGLSVVAHGLSAAPLAARYADWFASHPRDRAPSMESRPAASHRLRGAIGLEPLPGDAGNTPGGAA